MSLVEAIKNSVKAAAAPVAAGIKTRDTQQAAERKAARIAAGDPVQQEHDYAAARRSMLGEFSTEPISAVQPCMANAKAVSRQNRLNLVGKALDACPGHREIATRLRRDMDEVENMRCAKHVYLANEDPVSEIGSQPPPGFKAATDAQLAAMGIDEGDLKPEGSNFRAAVYVKDPDVWGPEPRPQFVLAFRGTTPNREDWNNNFAQDANNESMYYHRAVALGEALRKSNADVQIVGHSLGGGLASAAQGASGLGASTYNSAGLNPATVPRYSSGEGAERNAEPDKINAIRVKGEALTATLEGSGLVGMLASDAVGVKRDLEPATSESEFNQLKSEGKIDIKEDYATYLHGMDNVIAATEKQKVADQAALESCVESARQTGDARSLA